MYERFFNKFLFLYENLFFQSSIGDLTQHRLSDDEAVKNFNNNI